MANIKSQKKRVRTNELRRQRNVAVKSRIKTYMKHAEAAIESKDAAEIKKTVSKVISELDKAQSKGVYHANNVARKKSNIERRASQAVKS